ncbi:acyl carrier protein [Hanamia caeni]|jgi:acyl carrier protein|uniref:Acyl carrier protein n=1 Tax=Hanamia caeni TaxID=2294116 RepID=A0A3M9NIF8_9BACT|nr:acyl carrier protein [Hanamia caeni]RNI37491.1 acyl carrier protein [Hanamia caeni]
MDENIILSEVNSIFIEVFEDKSIILNGNTTSDDVPAWDSLNHIQMINAVEKHFKIRFELNDLLNFTDVGGLCRGILKKMN